jgi:hypothetical protein
MTTDERLNRLERLATLNSYLIKQEIDGLTSTDEYLSLNAERNQILLALEIEQGIG